MSNFEISPISFDSIGAGFDYANYAGFAPNEAAGTAPNSAIANQQQSYQRQSSPRLPLQRFYKGPGTADLIG